MPRGTQAGRSMHVQPDIPSTGGSWLSGMEPHPQPRPRLAQGGVHRQSTLYLDRGCGGISRSAEDNEKAVALGVDFTTVVLLDRRAHQAALCLQHRGIVIAKPID